MEEGAGGHARRQLVDDGLVVTAHSLQGSAGVAQAGVEEDVLVCRDDVVDGLLDVGSDGCLIAVPAPAFTPLAFLSLLHDAYVLQRTPGARRHHITATQWLGILQRLLVCPVPTNNQESDGRLIPCGAGTLLPTVASGNTERLVNSSGRYCGRHGPWEGIRVLLNRTRVHRGGVSHKKRPVGAVPGKKILGFCGSSRERQGPIAGSAEEGRVVSEFVCERCYCIVCSSEAVVSRHKQRVTVRPTVVSKPIEVLACCLNVLQVDALASTGLCAGRDRLTALKPLSCQHENWTCQRDVVCRCGHAGQGRTWR